jgi:hypothetical protein
MKKIAGGFYRSTYTKKDETTARRIYYLLLNTRDWQIEKRQITMRLGYRPLFQECYQDLLAKHVLTELGSGKPGDPCIVRLANHEYFKQPENNA